MDHLLSRDIEKFIFSILGRDEPLRRLIIVTKTTLQSHNMTKSKNSSDSGSFSLSKYLPSLREIDTLIAQKMVDLPQFEHVEGLKFYGRVAQVVRAQH